MPHDEKAKAAMKGLKNAGVDAQVAERTKINQIMSGKGAEGLPKDTSRPGLQGPQRKGDIHLLSDMSFDELMARAKAIR